MIEIIDDIPLVPKHSFNKFEVVIGYIKPQDQHLSKIPLQECADGLVELHLNGKPYARGELTMQGKSGSVKVIDLY